MLLAMLDADHFAHQLGADILHDPIAYARQHHGAAHREFQCLGDLDELADLGGPFDGVTAIEVIEHFDAHLDADEIPVILAQTARRLAPGGGLVLTTPNYPILSVFTRT